MGKRIDNIIKKAECLYKVLTEQGKETNNLDNLISSLISYRDNIGDIALEKEFYFTIFEPSSSRDSIKYLKDNKIPFRLCNDELNAETSYVTCSRDFIVIGIKLVDFTEYIKEKLCKTGAHFISIPPVCLGENIADAVFDIQSYPIRDNPTIVAELYKNGFTTNGINIQFIYDFD